MKLTSLSFDIVMRGCIKVFLKGIFKLFHHEGVFFLKLSLSA